MCVCLKYRGSVGRWPHFHPSTTAPGFLCAVHRHRLNSGKETPSPRRLLFSINNNNSYPLVHYHTKSVGVVSCRRRWIVVLQTNIIFFKSYQVPSPPRYYIIVIYFFSAWRAEKFRVDDDVIGISLKIQSQSALNISKSSPLTPQQHQQRRNVDYCASITFSFSSQSSNAHTTQLIPCQRTIGS